MSRHQGIAAFLCAGDEEQPPITLRDYFAAKAMAAVISHHGIYSEDSGLWDAENCKREAALTFEQAAEYAFGQADAMLAERAK